MLALLKHERLDVRYAVLVMLGRDQKDWATEAVTPLLHDPDGGIRWRAAVALGNMGDASAIEPLLALLKQPLSQYDPKKEMSFRVPTALMHIRDPRAVQALLDLIAVEDYPNKQWIYGDLASSGDPRVLELYLRQLNTPDDPGFQFALGAIYQMANTTQPWPEMLKNPRIQDALITTLKDPRPTVMPINNLYQAVDDQAPSRRAANILGIIGDRQAVEPLIAALDAGDPILRLTAADALGKLNDHHAVAPLIEALDHFGHVGRPYVLQALRAVTGQQFSEDPAEWRAWWAKEQQK
jgi:HEAT repeat protein